MYCLLENIFDHPQSAETFWIPAEGIISHLNRDSTIVMSHSVTCCCVTPLLSCHTLLHVVACCWELLRKVWNRSNVWANNSYYFFCSVIAEA